MRSYTIKKIEHFVYEDLDEIPKDLVYLKEWREGEVGDWVLADDGCVIQILRKNALAKHTKKVQFDYTIGTCTGTFAVRPTVKMDTERREDIYSMSGKIAAKRVKGDKNLTKNEILFSQLLARGVSADEAYLKVYRTNNRKYAKLQAGILVKSERIKKAMKEELKPILSSLGISPELVLEGIKDIATDEDAKHSDKLKALFELGEILELKETNKVTEVTGALFQGFQPEQIQASVRPQLKE
jgi:hydrogenase maturation factor